MIIKPFRAIRPAEDKVSFVAALPYDVYSREEALVEAKAHPLSFLNIDRPETQFGPDFDMYSPAAYEKASEMLDTWRIDGIFVQDEKPCFYIYALTMDGRTQTGLAACSSVDDYVSEKIRKHENTRADKELDRIHHVEGCHAQTGPIFLAYRAVEEVDALIEKEKEKAPLYDFVSEDGIRHAIWRIDEDKVVEKIVSLFSKMENTYIADGHHRAASAVKAALNKRAADPGYSGDEEYNFFLSVLFPQNQLRILDYNRVLKSLNGLTAEAFLQKVDEKFVRTDAEGTEPYRPQKKGEFGMFFEGKWQVLTAKEEILSTDPVEGLDVSLLQNHLLGPVLGIDDPKTSKNIDFVGGIRGLSELERRCSLDCVLAFSMYPTSMEELFSVADAHLLMPPKSTWFEPKLRSGLLIHEFER